jgi:putative oxidoreductase
VLVHRRAAATQTEAKLREDALGVAVPATFAKTRIDSLLTVGFSNSYCRCKKFAIVTVTKTQPDTKRRDEGAGEENTMRETGTVGQTPSTRAIRRRVPNIALWALQTLLAIMVAMAGLAKVFGDPAMVEMFATIGVGQWFRYVVGALEIAGAVGVLVPRLSGLAALGLVCLMAGATLTNIFVLGASPLLPLVLLAVSALVALGRWPRTRTLFTNREAGRPQ